MRVGINYPWMNYGWDFGPPLAATPARLGGRAPPGGPPSTGSCTTSAPSVSSRCAGSSSPTACPGASATSLPAGGIIGPWRFEPAGPLSAEFVEDFAFLLSRCRAAGVQLLPSLIDFRFCHFGIRPDGAGAYVKQGRGDILCDPDKRRLFLDQVLRPLLAASAAYPDVIYAWELINEPEWCTRMDGFVIDALNPRRVVSQAAMLAFLREGVGLINGAGFLSTVGFNRHSTLSEWDSAGLGITLHQFHYYASQPQVPPHTFDPRWPCIVGEFASAPHRPWPELGDAQDVYSRLRLIQDRGYPAAFLWSARTEPDPPPSAVAWNDATRADIERYLRERSA